MHRKRLFVSVALLFITVNICSQNEGLKQIDFFIGEWNIEAVDILPDGSFQKNRAKSIVKYILDGEAIQDDYLLLDNSDTVIFRGTSIRSYNKDTKKYQIVWIMPGHKGITDIVAEWKNNKLISTGQGYDSYGRFLERFEYYDITPNSYKFKMDRSYDNGKNWIENFGKFTATRLN